MPLFKRNDSILFREGQLVSGFRVEGKGKNILQRVGKGGREVASPFLRY